MKPDLLTGYRKKNSKQIRFAPHSYIKNAFMEPVKQTHRIKKTF